MILDDLVAATKIRLTHEKQQVSFAEIKKQAEAMPIGDGLTFSETLEKPGIHIIGEIKKASPSKGLIAAQFPYETIADAYNQAGITAISVLTEPDYFQGKLTYLEAVAKRVNVPVLRKDFTIDPYMIYQAKVSGAKIILLIVSILTQPELQEYLNLATSLGLSAIVEAHSEVEIKRALAVNAKIIGVNNRNLKDFSMNLTNSERLRKFIPKSVAMIAESGIKNCQDVKRLELAGINGVLIGETLMRATDKVQMIKELEGAFDGKNQNLRVEA